jgi:mRNA interferase MazF
VAGERLEIGDVIRVCLPRHLPSGHEQEGQRPAVVIGVVENAGTSRFPMLLIAPMTTQIESWTTRNPLLYPIVSAGLVGLTQDSAILLDQIRVVSLSRLLGFSGTLEQSIVKEIRVCLATMFELQTNAKQ